MEDFLSAHAFDCVVDATTLMQWKSHKIFNLPVQINLFPYLRLLRENSEYRKLRVCIQYAGMYFLLKPNKRSCTAYNRQ